MHFARARLTSHLGHGLAESLSLRLLGIGQKISTTEDTEGTENDLAPPCAPVPPVVKLSVRVAAPRCEAKDPCILPALVSLLIWDTGSQNRSPCASWESVKRSQPQRTQRAQRNDLAPPCAPVPPVVKLSVRVAAPRREAKDPCILPALVSLLIWNTGSQNRSPCASWESVRRSQPQRTQRAQRNDLAPPCSPVPPVVKLSVRVLPSISCAGR